MDVVRLLTTWLLSHFTVVFSSTCLSSNNSAFYPADCGVWGKQFGSSAADISNAIATDSISGVIAVVGQTTGDLFSENIAPGTQDWFLSIHDQNNGTLLWGLQDGTAQEDSGRSVAVDQFGDVLIVGYTASSLYATTAGGRDYFVVKLNGLNGSYIWEWQYGGSRDDIANAVTTMENGDIIVVGSTTSALYRTSSAGGNDIFIVRLRSIDGVIIWAKQYGAVYNDYANAVSIDIQGDIIVGGSTANMFATTTINQYCVFVSKYSGGSGEWIWGLQMGSGSNPSQATYGVVADFNGDVFATGMIFSAVFGAYEGSGDIFVAKFNGIDGKSIWSIQNGTTRSDAAYSIAVDTAGDVIVGGLTQYEFFGPLIGVSDYFLLKTSGNSGKIVWDSQGGTTEYDVVEGVSIDSTNSLLVTGYTSGSLYGNSSGSNDYFVMRYSCPPGYYFNATSETCIICPLGTYNGGFSSLPQCILCPPGFYNDNTGAVKCSECAKGTFTDKNGSVVCDTCPKITYSDEASTNCPFFNFEFSYVYISVLIVFYTIATVFLASYAGITWGYGVVILLSSGDVFSDIVYILTATFYRRWLLALIILFTFLPAIHVPIVLYRLANMNRQKRESQSSRGSNDRSSLLYELRQFFDPPAQLFPQFRVHLIDRIPYILETRLLPTAIKRIDNLGTFALYIVVMFFSGIYWLVWFLFDCIYYSPWTVIHLPYFLVVTVFGYYLMQSKLFSHPKIRRLFDRVCWAGDVVIELDKIDTAQINELNFFEVVLESIPQLVMQCMNESYGLHGSNPPTVFVVSVTITSLVIATNLYRFLYWTVWIGIPIGKMPMLLKSNLKSKAKQNQRAGEDGLLMGSVDSRSASVALETGPKRPWVSFLTFNRFRSGEKSGDDPNGELTPMMKNYIDTLVASKMAEFDSRMKDLEDASKVLHKEDPDQSTEDPQTDCDKN